MNNKILINIAFLIFGSLFAAFMLKTLVSFYYDHSSTKFTIPSLPSTVKSHSTESIYFPLKEQYGLTLNNTKSCEVNSKSLILEEGYHYNMNSNCWNDSCTVNVNFTKKIPKELSIYVSENNNCILKKFKVEDYIKVVGYVVDLQLTQTQKDKLHIKYGDKIRLAQSNGYSLNSQNQFYFYKTKLLEDDILVDNMKKGKVYFSNKGKIENTNNKVIENVNKIHIPHPKELFTYTCDNSRKCEKKANTYIINVDGLDFIPDEEFIQKCMENKSASRYCNTMIEIGNVSTLKFNSENEMNQYIKETKNPEFNDMLEEWEKDRFERVKEKLMRSIK